VTACEDFCRSAMKKGTQAVTAAVVERALGMANVPLSASRKNVIPKGQEAIKGAICGLYVYADNIGVASFSRRHPWLTRLLAAFCHREQPNFKFTSIQVNVNYASRPHVDRNNLGASYIIGLGKYTGGALWVHKDDGNKAHTLEDEVTLAPMYNKGDTYMGSDTNIQGRWTQFNGNRLHLTRPFQGTRYSLVYFTCDRYAESAQEVREELKGMAFPFKWESVKLQKMLATKKVERQRIVKLFSKVRASLHKGVVPQLVDDDSVRYETQNPKRFGCNAYKFYKKYSQARTLGDAVRLGARAIDLIHDYNHGFLHVVGLSTKSAEWDFEIKDGASAKQIDPSLTAIGEADGKTVKVRVGEMHAKNKGLDMPRKSLAMLAARIPKLHRTPEARWATEASPTAAVPLKAMRALLHWAATGRLRCTRGSQKEAVRAALEAWGEHGLAARVEAEGQDDAEEEEAVAATKGAVAVASKLAKRKQDPAKGKTKTHIRMKLRPKPVTCRSKSHNLSRAGLQHKADDAIRFVQQNPKTPDSLAYKRYDKYKTAKTVQQALNLGATRPDIRYDYKFCYCKRYRPS